MQRFQSIRRYWRGKSEIALSCLSSTKASSTLKMLNLRATGNSFGNEYGADVLPNCRGRISTWRSLMVKKVGMLGSGFLSLNPGGAGVRDSNQDLDHRNCESHHARFNGAMPDKRPTCLGELRRRDRCCDSRNPGKIRMPVSDFIAGTCRFFYRVSKELGTVQGAGALPARQFA